MGKPRMLAGLRALLIPIGWSANAAEETRKLLRELGAEVFSEEETGTDVSHSSQNKLDVAITALTSTSRIGRHLPRDSLNANLPVVASTWVKACADSGQMLPFKDYEVAVPDNFRPVHVKAKEEEPSPKKESKPVIPARPKRSSTLASLAADAAERRRRAALEGHGTDVDTATAAAASKFDPLLNAQLAADGIGTGNSLGASPSTKKSSPTTHVPAPPPQQRQQDMSDDSDVSEDNYVTPSNKKMRGDSKGAQGQLAPGFFNTRFACQRATPLKSPNDHICSDLNILAEMREFTGNEMNALAYRRAVAAIRSYPRKITSADEANQILGVGKKIAMKVGEYVQRGRIAEAEKIRHDPRFKLMQMFEQVYGVGPVKAREWADKGYRSLDDVRARELKLTSQQQMGLKYWEHLSQRIPRAEVEAIGKLVTEAARKVDKGIISTNVGGYRRGKPDSGDVDVLLAHPVEGGERGLLRAIVQKLKEDKIIVELLSYSEHTPPDSEKEHNGIPKEGYSVDCLDKAYTIIRSPVSNMFRQVDIVVSPIGCYGAAVVGWSGSTMFERSIREFAEKEKRLQFQSWGIFDRRTGERIECKDERDVFKILGLEYLPPELRCC